MEDTEKTVDNSSIMLKVATFVVDRRNLFFLLFVMAIVFSIISSGWVDVENSLAEYLPETTETKQGIELMDEEFKTYGSAKIMATNINYTDAEIIADKIEGRPDVTMVDFDETEDHYKNFSALYNITLKYEEDDDRALTALDEIKELLSDYDIFVSTSMGDQQADIINEEMKTVSVVVAVIVVTVLIITSETWAEIPVLLLTFGAAALIASGTNFLFGTISFVSNSVTIVLQLALSIDYAVIFCNRYKEEHRSLPIREADIVALSKAIPEISASSLTTIGGLIAMMFMQYGIGPDMAICLIKSIFFSLLAVFTLMPGLLMIFGSWMDKTHHKSFIPKIPFVGRFDYATRYIIPPIFLAVVIAAFFISNKCPYVYGYSTLPTPVRNDIQIANDMINESFGEENKGALMVPAGDYDKEKRLIRQLESREEIDHIVGLSNTEAMDGYTLTDRLTARQFSELLGVDYEAVELLYAAYAINDDDYAKVINGSSTYEIPLIDMMMFMYDEVNDGYVTLNDDLNDKLTEAYDKLVIAKEQLQGENYSRMLVYLNLPEEGDETFAFIDEIHEIARTYYEEGRILMAGEANSQYDLKKTFLRDNTVVNWVSILAVLAVLLFTFMSVGMPILLIIVIQGSIWMNFSYPAILQQNIFFMSYLIVESIQMGANIDYAIVISGRFLELKETMSKKRAIIETLNFAFPTIVTSGSMLALAGFTIGRLSSDGSICGIGQCLCRGTLMSIFLVMFVLPQILLLGEKIIDASSFKVSMPIRLDRTSGLIRLDGVVQGNINGHFVGEMHGILRGDASVLLVTGKMINKKDDDGSGEGISEDDFSEHMISVTDIPVIGVPAQDEPKKDLPEDKDPKKVVSEDKKPKKDVTEDEQPGTDVPETDVTLKGVDMTEEDGDE